MFSMQWMYIHTVCSGCMCMLQSVLVNLPQLVSKIWWINTFGGLSGYSLVLVYYIGTGKLWWINRFDG